jgi:glycerol-3-phosphate dehydrogenase (NAD(P)+)
MGAGAFGTALAISLCQNGAVTLWARDPEHVSVMQAHRENTQRLPGSPLPETLHVTNSRDDLKPARIVLISVPMQRLRSFLETYGDTLADKTLVACCKGIELNTGLGPISVITSVLPETKAALLTGPSFASDIAKGLPTALTIACSDVATGKALQNSLSTKVLRLYRTSDAIGAELGGALKNVIAIASGAAIGAGLGDSARAAVMTRGFAEMNRLAVHLGGHPSTLSGLSGFGDLTLTCTSSQSRNYRLGLSIGAGKTFDPAVTVEGASTALAVATLSQKHNIEMPITQAVAGLIENRLDVQTAMSALLSRPLKEE